MTDTTDTDELTDEEALVMNLMKAYDLGYQDACDDMARHLLDRQRLPVDEVILGDEETLESD